MRECSDDDEDNFYEYKCKERGRGRERERELEREWERKWEDTAIKLSNEAQDWPFSNCVVQVETKTKRI